MIQISDFAMLDARDCQLIAVKDDGKYVDNPYESLNKTNCGLLIQARKEYLDKLIQIREEIKTKYDNLFVEQENGDVITEEELEEVGKENNIYNKKYWSVFYH